MSILKYIVLVMLTAWLALISCKKETQLPIAEDQLIEILCDIHIAESAIDVINGTEKDTAATKVYDQIYSIHQVDSADVDSCLSYLKKNPKSAEKIYTKVIEQLEAMQKKER